MRIRGIAFIAIRSLHQSGWRKISITLKTPSMSAMASLEKSRNSLQTGGCRRASFHASL
jgi:hypothetical protein